MNEESSIVGIVERTAIRLWENESDTPWSECSGSTHRAYINSAEKLLNFIGFYDMRLSLAECLGVVRAQNGNLHPDLNQVQERAQAALDKAYGKDIAF